MPERVTRVVLRTVTAEYIEGMRRAADETMRTGSAAEKLAQQRQAMETLGRTALGLGTAIGVGVGVAVARAAEFERAMSQVNAVTQESAENQAKLREAALELGGATIYTAREAANAEEELAKAGLATSQILGGALAGSLDLAASGQLEVARAAEITGITLKQFGLDGAQASRVADVLSAGANKAVGSVEDLANGLKFVGPVAASMNVSLEDTVATLTLFADRGIIGEQAGTSLRGMLSSLTSPSKAAQKQLEALGVTLYDGKGQFLGMENTAGQLQKALAGLSDSERDLALGVIFGNQQVTAARVLVDAGAASWRDYRNAVDDTGIAARIAQDRMDNLAGDVEKLGGAFDTVLIKGGTGVNDVLRDIVQGATQVVDRLGAMPEPILGVVTGIGALTAGTLVLGGTILLTVPKVYEFKLAMDRLNLTAGSLALKFSKGSLLVLGLTAAAAALTNIGDQAELTEKDLAKLNSGFRQGGDDLNKLFEGMQGTSLATNGVSEALAKLRGGGINQWWNELNSTIWDGVNGVLGWIPAVNDLHNGIKKNEAQFTALGKSLGQLAHEDLGAAAEGFKRLVAETDGSDESIRMLLDVMPDYEAALVDIAAQSGVTLEGQALLNAAVGEGWWATKLASQASRQNAAELQVMGSTAEDVSEQVDDLSDKIRNFGSLTLDARSAQREFEAALDDLTASVKENGTTLDISTDKGRANQAALDAIAKSTLELAAAKYDQTHSEQEAAAAIQQGRDALIAQLAQFGIVGDEAAAYADSLGLIPSNIDTIVAVSTDGAQKTIDSFIRTNDGRVISFGGRIVMPDGSRINPGMFADGGMVNHRVIANAGGAIREGMYSGGPPLYKFAEPETGWETFISGRPGRERENFGYALESMMRLSQQMGYSLGMSGGGSQVDQSVTANFKVDAADPVVAAEFIGQRISGYMAVRL
ncbi:MAG: phage tail tape measure protein [Protaetiibacter sp.]